MPERMAPPVITGLLAGLVIGMAPACGIIGMGVGVAVAALAHWWEHRHAPNHG